MKYFKDILFYVLLAIIPAGFFLRMNDRRGGPTLMAAGLLSVFLFFTINTINDYVKNRTMQRIMVLPMLISLMSITLFAKYFYYKFWDYPALVIIPVFVLCVLFLLFNGELKNQRLMVTSGLFILLIIPLFVFHALKEPRKYMPTQWTNRYDVRGSLKASLPYQYKKEETRRLSDEGYHYRKSGDYIPAVLAYEEAHKLEPDNPFVLFDLSGIYAHLNNLEKAITTMDTAIMIDDSFGDFYCNRGLLYYKLTQNKKAIKDYNKAISLDPGRAVYYANIALAYYYENEFDSACEAITKTRQLGMDISGQKELLEIESKHCK